MNNDLNSKRFASSRRSVLRGMYIFKKWLSDWFWLAVERPYRISLWKKENLLCINSCVAQGKIFSMLPASAQKKKKSSVFILFKSFFSRLWLGKIHSGVLKALPPPPAPLPSARVSFSVWGPKAHQDTWRIYNTGLWAAYLRFLFKQTHLEVGTGSP